MKKNLLSLAALLTFVVVMGVSCIQVQQAPATAGGVSNERYSRITGVYNANLGCSLFEADEAVRAAAKTMKLTQLSRDNLTSLIQYEYKDIYEARISVDLTLDVNGQAKIAIKFSKIGDKDFSQKFIAAIDEQLRAE